MYQQVVKNPYLRLFYQLMFEQDILKVFEEQAKSNNLINIFDFITLACKFLNFNQLKNVL